MANKGGNKRKCRSCHRLAGLDGWCKRHRPEKKHKPWVRDNFIDNNFMSGGKEFHKEDYGAVRDTFPCVKEGY